MTAAHTTRPACPGCGCCDPAGAAAHAITGDLLAGDVDAAICSGLLACASCDGCATDCTARLLVARDNRVVALAARGRYRARTARLHGRATELAARRAPACAVDDLGDSTAATPAVPALPAAAAAALARAKAKAAERRKP